MSEFVQRDQFEVAATVYDGNNENVTSHEVVRRVAALSVVEAVQTFETFETHLALSGADQRLVVVHGVRKLPEPVVVPSPFTVRVVRAATPTGTDTEETPQVEGDDRYGGDF